MCLPSIHEAYDIGDGVIAAGWGNTKKVGKVNRAQLEEVATAKWPDLTAADMDAAVRTIAGSARSAGIETEGVN